MIDCVNSRASVEILIFETNVEASFISGFRFCPFCLAKCQIIIYGTMKVGNKFCRIRPFIRNEGSNSLYLSEKYSIIF